MSERASNLHEISLSAGDRQILDELSHRFQVSKKEVLHRALQSLDKQGQPEEASAEQLERRRSAMSRIQRAPLSKADTARWIEETRAARDATPDPWSK